MLLNAQRGHFRVDIDVRFTILNCLNSGLQQSRHCLLISKRDMGNENSIRRQFSLELQYSGFDKV